MGCYGGKRRKFDRERFFLRLIAYIDIFVIGCQAVPDRFFRFLKFSRSLAEGRPVDDEKVGWE